MSTPSPVQTLVAEALHLQQQGQFLEAEAKYLEALEWDEQNSDLWNHLSCLYYAGGQLELAFDALQQAIALAPRANYYYHLGLVLEQTNEAEQAADAYRSAIAIEPQFFDAYNNLGNLCLQLGDLEQAEQAYREAIAVQPTHWGGYLNLGNLYSRQRRSDEAIACYEAGLQQHPDHYDLICILAAFYSSSNRIEAAIQLYERGIQLYPESLELRVQYQQILPVLYSSEEEIEQFRQRFIERLNDWISRLDLQTSEGRQQALASILKRNSFYLQYQGKNDLEVQKRINQTVFQIMRANYPQYAQPCAMPALPPSKKIRLGYISNFMRNHTVSKLFLGWLRHADRAQFEIYCYYTDDREDEITEEFRCYSDRFYAFSTPAIQVEEPQNQHFEAIAQQIAADQLHLLVYLDVGMSMVSNQLIGVRLAPVQCMTWGHPITSGSPVMDYYLTSELMEPEEADAHYSETLVRLPNLSIAYARPQQMPSSKKRQDFGLRDDGVVYLSCQSLYKYLPQYDRVFGAIAQQVPNAQFVFLADISGQHTTNCFRQRLQRAFAECNLNSEAFCVILPRLDAADYFAVNSLADVYLDTLGWSGGNTTMEAIACGLPIVTCPGEFMRGRHSSAILQMLGMTETIAGNIDHYIQLAIRLGIDEWWRKAMAEQVKERSDRIYNDMACVHALETFYRQVVHSRLS